MIAAVIILFNPDPSVLGRLLSSVVPQVDRVIVVDNTPGSSSRQTPISASFRMQVLYVPLGDNRGVAAAQNIGIRRGVAEGCSHIMLLDQDSIPGREMVRQLLRSEENLLEAGHKVAAVAPIFIDNKINTPSHAIRHRLLWVERVRINLSRDECVESDYVISSGSVIRVSVLQEVGLMFDELFIDWVDIEWGLRARAFGYACFVAPTARMEHSLGDSIVRIPGRNVHMHSDIRNYYIVRNATYLLRMKSMGNRWRTVTALKLPQYLCFYSWHSPHRLGSFILLLRAIMDGLRGRLGRFA